MLRRLVRRRVLSRLAGTQPVRARERRTAREPRRRLAPRRSVEPRRAPLLAAAAPALLRLRRAPRPRLPTSNTRESHAARAGVDPEGGALRRPRRRGRPGGLVPAVRSL